MYTKVRENLWSRLEVNRSSVERVSDSWIKESFKRADKNDRNQAGAQRRQELTKADNFKSGIFKLFL